MFIDFRRNLPVTALTFINGIAVESVSQYRYLGTILDDKITFEANSDAIFEKANQRVF